MKVDKLIILATVASLLVAGCVTTMTTIAITSSQKVAKLEAKLKECSKLQDTLAMYRQHYIRAIDSESGTVLFLKGKGVYKPGDCVWADDSLNIIDSGIDRGAENAYLHIIIP